MRRAWWVLAGMLVVSAFFVGTLYAGSPLKTWIDPDLGKTHDQVVAEQQAESNAFWARYPGWISDQVASGIDPAKLPTATILATVSDPAPTLAESTKQAKVVISGTVSALEFRASGDTVATIEVSRSMKGSAGATIQVVFAGGLRPFPDWDHVTLGVLEEAPMPLPKTDVVLFLGESAIDKGLFEPQMYTGVYVVGTDGLIKAVDGNPFADTISKLTPADLATAVAALAR